MEVLDIDVEVQGRPAGLPSRTKPRGQDEEGANAGTIAEPSKTNHGEITLDLSAAGRSGGRDDQGRQADRKTDRKRVGEGGTTGRGRPSRRVSPTLVIRRGVPFALASKTGFFLLHAAKVRSSCEEGPGQSALQSAYHNPKLDVTELKQHQTS